MTIASNIDFAKRMALLAKPVAQFKPMATYDPDGDCIEFLAKPDAFYAERIDHLVAVYYSQETGEVIGSLIQGAARFCREILQQTPGFKIEVQDGPVRLEHIFLARLWSANHQPEEPTTLTYRKLIDVARETVVEGELCLA